MIRIAMLIAAVSLASVQTLAQADSCEGFKWDVSRERALFAADPQGIVAGRGGEKVVSIEPEHLYELRLAPQEQVQLAAPPSKKSISDGASAGLVRFHVEQEGQYRVALSHGFWVDVIVDGKPLQSLDFSGSPDCAAPRKVVVYALPARQELLLQLSGNVEESVRVSVTAVSAKP